MICEEKAATNNAYKAQHLNKPTFLQHPNQPAGLNDVAYT